jgi:hypothetical protein
MVVMKVGSHVKMPDGRRVVIKRLREGHPPEFRELRWYERVLLRLLYKGQR